MEYSIHTGVQRSASWQLSSLYIIFYFISEVDKETKQAFLHRHKRWLFLNVIKQPCFKLSEALQRPWNDPNSSGFKLTYVLSNVGDKLQLPISVFISVTVSSGLKKCFVSSASESLESQQVIALTAVLPQSGLEELNFQTLGLVRA